MEAVEVERPVRPARVAFSLSEDVLGTKGQFLGLNDPEQFPVHKQGVVGRAIGGGVFGDRVGGQLGENQVWGPADDGPAQGDEFGINPRLAGLPLEFGLLVSRHGLVKDSSASDEKRFFFRLAESGSLDRIYRMFRMGFAPPNYFVNSVHSVKNLHSPSQHSEIEQALAQAV